MHKFVLKTFGFLRSSVKFVKVILVFLVLMLILYWIQDLTNNSWSWLGFISPFFDNLLETAKEISSDSIMLYKAVFEFKYPIAFLFIGITYVIVHFSYIGLDFLEDLYDSARRLYKKVEEDALNTKLAVEQTYEQKKIRFYQIYVQTFVKSAFAHREYNVNIEEQNKILIKHLVEKTGICPSKYQEGFLFNFNSFDKVDDMLDVFSKLNQSKAPLDFLICLQINESSSGASEEELNTLISLKILNKITTLANTAYRYSFNTEQRYRTSQVGLFQKGESDFEVHEFVSKN